MGNQSKRANHTPGYSKRTNLHESHFQEIKERWRKLLKRPDISPEFAEQCKRNLRRKEHY